MFTHGPREGSTDSDCEVCAPGSFSDAMGVAACAPCPNGTASSVVGAVSNATWLVNPKPAAKLECNEATTVLGPDAVTFSFQ